MNTRCQTQTMDEQNRVSVRASSGGGLIHTATECCLEIPIELTTDNDTVSPTSSLLASSAEIRIEVLDADSEDVDSDNGRLWTARLRHALRRVLACRSTTVVIALTAIIALVGLVNVSGECPPNTNEDALMNITIPTKILLNEEAKISLTMDLFWRRCEFLPRLKLKTPIDIDWSLIEWIFDKPDPVVTSTEL